MDPITAQFSTARSLTESCSSSARAWNIPIKSALRCSLSNCLANFYTKINNTNKIELSEGTYAQISRSSSADHRGLVFAQLNEQAYIKVSINITYQKSVEHTCEVPSSSH